MTRNDQRLNQTTDPHNQQNNLVSGQDFLANNTDIASSHGEDDQFSDISPYSPNSDLDQTEQEGDPLSYGNAIRDVFELLGDE